MASIYLRGKTWWVSYYQGGRLIQRSLKTPIKTVAKYRKNDIENKLEEGGSPLPDKNILALDALNSYVEESQHQKTSKTIRDDTNRLKAFLTWAGISRLAQIDEPILSKYIKKRLDAKEITLTTANHTIKTVKAFLNFCLKRGLVKSNSLQTMKRYKIDKKSPRYLSKEEIKMVLDSCKGSEILPMVLLALYTGMRYGEILNLQSKNIDFRNKTITVPKSKAGCFRIIPIHDALLPRLKEITLPFRSMSSPQAIRLLQRITGQTNIGWHTFRHTFASHLVMNGVDIVTVGKLLGHSRIETTMIYSHLSDGHVRESIGKLRI